MATIRAYTTIEQSRKLAEILPLQSADMYWDYDVQKHEHYPMVMDDQFDDTCIYAWSLAALLSVLPKGIVINKDAGNGKYHVSSTHIGTYVTADNPVDACVEMIEKLHEFKRL